MRSIDHLTHPAIVDNLRVILPAKTQAALLQTARGLDPYKQLECFKAHSMAAYTHLVNWEIDHAKPCRLDEVEYLHLNFPKCLQLRKHPFEGITDWKGRSGKSKDPKASAAFDKIRLSLPHHSRHDHDIERHVKLDYLVVVHSYTKLALGNVDIQNIVGPTTKWEMDIPRLEALVACRSVMKLSLTRCVLSNNWLPTLLSA